ncbi:hypothetical protein NAI36_13055, partial [Francisella tularensis subsp. holarctica]|nr:hypothetical protein [Francisella tularensis subsp. holarctica]
QKNDPKYTLRVGASAKVKVDTLYVTTKIRNKILPLALISATIITSSCSFFNPEYERPKIKAPALRNNQDKNIEVKK